MGQVRPGEGAAGIVPGALMVEEFAVMDKSGSTFTIWSWLFFAVTIVIILAMTLMGSDLLNKMYLSSARMLPVDPVWVKKHLTGISNAGHLLSCFVLTCLGFAVFREGYLKATGSVAALAVLGELLQEFTATRQARVEDVALGFAGILLASVFVFLIKTQRHRH